MSRRVIPKLGVSLREFLEELGFNPDMIAKFQFPERHPWTYPTYIVNLTFYYNEGSNRTFYIHEFRE